MSTHLSNPQRELSPLVTKVRLRNAIGEAPASRKVLLVPKASLRGIPASSKIFCKESSSHRSYLNKNMGRSRYKQHETWYPYFLTSSFVHGLPLFAKPEIVQLVIDALKFHQLHNGLKIYAYCIMENHFHLIAEHDDFKKCMQSIKSYTAKQILDYLKAK
ncbi:MAG: transposase, partial [Balneolaceae bacterium]